MSSSEGSPSSTTTKRGRTVPIAVLFAIGCIIIVAAFTAVTVYAGLSFTSTVDDMVTYNLDLALRGAMQQIRIPLDESERYLNQLRDKIENEPDIYAINDSNPTTFETLREFFADTTFVGLERPEITSVYQVRLSTTYQHTPGHFVDSLALVNFYPGSEYELLIFINNTIISTISSDKAKFKNTSLFEVEDFPYNTSGEDYLYQTYTTSEKKWDIATYTIPDGDPNNPTTTLMTLYAKIRGFDRFGIGIDHNMVDFRECMRQTTAPFTTGTFDAEKVMEEGAHSSLYDMSRGALMTTSVKNMKLYQPDTTLWLAGQTPNDDLNEAYQHAVSLCDSVSCGGEPISQRFDNVMISVVRHRQNSTLLDMMLVSVVPYDYFYARPNKSLYVSIAVAVVCCVVIIAGCIALLAAIGPKLSSLQENMLLASELKNDKVVHTHSILTDIAVLSSVFDEMNQRLLIARSFVPEAVLLGQVSNDDDEINTSDEDEGEHDAISNITPNRSHNNDRLSQYSTTLTSATTNVTATGETLSRIKALSERRVAVLSLNLVGFGHLIGARDSTASASRQKRIIDVSGQLLQIIVKAAQRDRGVMDSFHGDHFILTFNASRVVVGALAAAVRTANRINDDVRRDPQFIGSLGVASGAAVSKAQIGTLGIDGHRRLSVVGPSYRSAIGLQEVCSQFIQQLPSSSLDGSSPPNVGCVLDQSGIREICNSAMYMQLIGVVIPPRTTRPAKEARRIYAVYDSGTTTTTNGAGEEWLYEMDSLEAGDPYIGPNAAVSSLIDGDVDACLQLLRTAQEAANTRRRSSNISTPFELLPKESQVDEAASCRPVPSTVSRSGSVTPISPSQRGWAVVEHYISAKSSQPLTASQHQLQWESLPPWVYQSN